jgi:hypothetical protein
MFEPTKRILLIAGFILSVIGIAYGLYAAFFRSERLPPAPEGEQGAEQTALGGLSPAEPGAPTAQEEINESVTGLSQADEVALGGITQTTELTSAPIENPALSGDGMNMNFYDNSDGKFYRIDAQGNVSALSNKKFPNVEQATWDKDANKAVVEFPDGSNIVYDFENETQVTLPNHWEDFDFSPVSDELIAKSIGIDPDNRWLVLSNSIGSNVKSIQALGENESKVQVNWSPNNQVVAFSDTAEGTGSFDRKVIIPLGKEEENFKGIEVEGLGFQSKWSQDGKRLLYSVSGSYSNYRPLLWIVDATSATMGKNRKSLSINTWVDKCAWASTSTVYCAVPQGLPPNAGLQPKLFSTLADAIYKIDVNTGLSSLIAIPDGEKPMTNLFVTQDQSSLYFTNGQTGNLELLKLK